MLAQKNTRRWKRKGLMAAILAAAMMPWPVSEAAGNVSEEHAFSQIAKNFTGDWSRLRSSRARQNKDGIKLYLGNLALPEEKLNDFNDFDAKTVAYAYRDGHAHEGRRAHYETRITPFSGRYAFWYHTAASLSLVDSRTGKVILTRQVEARDDERYANALRKMFRSFYKEANKFLAEAGAKK